METKRTGGLVQRHHTSTTRPLRDVGPDVRSGRARAAGRYFLPASTQALTERNGTPGSGRVPASGAYR